MSRSGNETKPRLLWLPALFPNMVYKWEGSPRLKAAGPSLCPPGAEATGERGPGLGVPRGGQADGKAVCPQEGGR